MDTVELIQRLSVALAIGLLIGIERGWRERDEPEGSRAAGVRTLALSGLLGGIWAAILQPLGPAGAVSLGIAFAAFTAIVAVYRFRETEKEGTLGATTVIAAMLSFALGAFAVLGNLHAAVAAGIATTALLAMKTVLHNWVRQLSWAELRSGLLLLAMTFLLLPLLPDRTIDPWQAINPYHLWTMTIVIAAISFVGYAAVRVFGAQRGILVTAVAGGLVSSTAVTLTLARLAKTNHGQRNLMAAGMSLASATMMFRVIGIVALFNTGLVLSLAPAIGAAGAVLTVAGLAFLKAGGDNRPAADSIELQNPFDLAVVLQFGALLAVILLLSRLTNQWLGDAGVLLLAVASGLADVDAITLSMSKLAGSEIAAWVAAAAIALAALSNSIVKVVLAITAGSGAAGRRFAAASAAAIVAGACGFAVQFWLR